MWLRDHAPMGIANARISIYGYSSDVGASDSISTLSEMTEAFVMDLVNCRSLGPLGHTGKVRRCNPTVLGSRLAIAFLAS